MNIPYYAILIVYLVVIFVFLMLSFFNLYHVVKFGLFNRTAKIVTLIFILISVGMFLVSWLFLADVDWAASFPLLEGFNFESELESSGLHL